MATETERSRSFTWADPTLGLGSVAGKTGLEQLREIFVGTLPPPPIAQTMGFTAAEFDVGRAVFVSEPAEFHYNPIGTVHGGFALTLLDSAMSCAVHSTLAAGERYTTIEVKVNFVRPITLETGRVRCEGTLINRGGTIGTAEGRLIAERTGKLLAHGTTTCLIIRA